MRTIIATTFCLIAACCAHPERIETPPMPVDPEHCGAGEGVHDYLSIEAAPARQGSSLRIAPMQWRGPAQMALPLDCASDWSVSDPAFVHISQDRTKVDIAADAKPGAIVTISYRVNGKEIRAAVTIVAKDAFVLTGRRAQTAAEGCGALTPVGELEFSDEGHFSVTYRPFETYKDYWGTYRLDAATGALSMTVEGGNDRPAGLDLDGKARFDENGKLVLEDMFLGQPSWGGAPPRPGASCLYVFG